jgi:hypothetical protein
MRSEKKHFPVGQLAAGFSFATFFPFSSVISLSLPFS